MLIVTVFIVIVSSCVSFAALVEPKNVKAQCLASGIKVTQDNHGEYPALQYKDGETAWTKVERADDSYFIPVPSMKEALIQFKHLPESEITMYKQYAISCEDKVGTVDALDITVGVKNEDLSGTGGASMTLNPSQFDLTTTSTITMKLPESYEKAIIKSCQIKNAADSELTWVPIHQCDKPGNKIIDEITYKKTEKTITAKMQQVSLTDVTTLKIQCAFAACYTGNCTGFDTTYGTDPKCKD